MVAPREPRDTRTLLQKIVHAELEKRAEEAYDSPTEESSDNKDDFLEAKQLRKKVEQDPENPEFHFQLAQEYEHLAYCSGKEINDDLLSQSIGGLCRAIELAKSSEQEVKYRIELARIYSMGHGDAVSQWDRIVQLDPENVEAHKNLTMWFDHFGQEEEAVAHLKKLIELEPKKLEHLKDLARVSFNIGGYSEAKQTAKRAIKLYLQQPEKKGSDLAYCCAYLGYVYAQQKEKRKAERLFKFGLNLEVKYGQFGPKEIGIGSNHLCFNGLVQTLYRLGEFEELEKLCERTISTWTPPDYKVYNVPLGLSFLFTGLRQLDKGNRKQAIENMRRAKELAFDIFDRVHKDFKDIYEREIGE